MKKDYEFLNQINFPSDLKKIPESKLQKVADELREEMIDAVSVTGGHQGASLGVVELNRTEVKAPFSGFIEQIVKPGNFLERGQICATIIQLDPITLIAGVPEYDINKVRIGQNVFVELVTGQKINGKLTFVSKSASPDTRTFSVESQIENSDGKVKDGLTAEISIEIDKVMAHKISPSILLLNDEGKLGIRIVNKRSIRRK